MLVRFLGTSAGELYPGIWCRCRNCELARSGDARDRRRSAALYVEPDGEPGVLIDFPSEIATQAALYGTALPEVQNLLVTHSHGDHWFPYLLRWRHRPAEPCAVGEAASNAFGAPRFTELPILHIWGNAAVELVLRRELGDNLEPYALAFHRVGAGSDFTVGSMQAHALAANHDIGHEDALHYVLESHGRTILYGLDGDTFLPETRDALAAFGFDLVIMEATYGFGTGSNHRNFDRLIAEADWFRNSGRLTDSGRIVATHFSPHHAPPHAETAAYLGAHHTAAAWDGMEIRL